MKITLNLITYNNGYGLTRDVQLLAGLITKFLPKGVEADMKYSDFYDYKIRMADANIFMEIPSYLLMPHAHLNVLIPNQEWYYKTWVPYVGTLDRIWTKSRYALDIYRSLMSEQGGNGTRQVNYLGWKSSDYGEGMEPELSDSWIEAGEEGQDSEIWLHVCGKSIYKQTQVIIDAWKPEYPVLEIIYSPRDVKGLVVREQDNLVYFTERLTHDQLVDKMRTRRVHLCPSETEGFGHYLHEAMSVGALIISTRGPPMNEWIYDSGDWDVVETSGVTPDNGVLVDCKKKPVVQKLGSRYIISPEKMSAAVERVMAMSVSERQRLGQQARQDYLSNLASFESRLQDFLKDLVDTIAEKRKQSPMFPMQRYISPVDLDSLPKVSVLTLVHNRKSFFKLAKMNFRNFKYPPEKLEWVIIDDSDPKESVWDLVPPDPRVQYVQKKTRMDLGAKRNESVRLASHDLLVIMDDDDYYPPESILRRVTYHLQSGRECVCSTILGCFEINKYISMINVPPHQLAFEDRISEASLLFTRGFWERQKFREDSRGSEAKEFLAGRLSECLEVTWIGILVALLHSRNTSTKIVRGDKPNGCHYGWSDELFLFITGLDS